jgi:plastocyanin
MEPRRMVPVTSIVLGLILAACSAVSTPRPPADNSAGGSVATPTPPLQLENTPILAPTVGIADVSIQNFAFSPAEITVAVGSTVRWTNQDSATHTVKAADGSWISPNIDQGGTFEKVFDKPGTYDYICGIHPTMKGRIIVI